MTIRCALVLATWVLAAVPGMAQDGGDPPCGDKDAPRPQVIFDHLKTNADRHYTVPLRPGEPLVVCVENTALARFTYGIVGIVKAPAPGPAAVAGEGPEALGTRRLVKPHDDQYGGYVVSIRSG